MPIKEHPHSKAFNQMHNWLQQLILSNSIVHLIELRDYGAWLIVDDRKVLAKTKRVGLQNPSFRQIEETNQNITKLIISAEMDYLRWSF